MIALVRVDNRLIHGQVVSTWIPHVKAEQVVVVDDEAASSPLIQAAMSMAVPPHLDVAITRAADVDWEKLASSKKRILVLVRDVANAERMVEHGVPVREINLGNIHFADGRKPVSASVFLSGAEVETLGRIASHGVTVEAQAVPSDHTVGLEEIRARFKAAS